MTRGARVRYRANHTCGGIIDVERKRERVAANPQRGMTNQETLRNPIRPILTRRWGVSERKMFGDTCFMVNEEGLQHTADCTPRKDI